MTCAELLADVFGGPSWSEIDAVFAKARRGDIVDEYRGIRFDVYGNKICRDDYGRRDKPMGWEIDHMIAQALGGSDHISNLQPLHWRANVEKSDHDYLSSLFV